MNETLLSAILLAVGAGLIIKGGDLFVVTCVDIARHTRIPRVVVGSTLVSLATTAPELAISVTASVRGNPGLAVGNAVGSAICNIGVVLGTLCLIRGFAVRRKDFRLPSLVMLGLGVALTVMTLSLDVGRIRGGLLLACGVGYLAYDYLRHRRGGLRQEILVEGIEADIPPPTTSLKKTLVLFVIGAAMVVGGSRLMSDNAVFLATKMGVPPMIIGLTLISFGTSLPELVTAISAARRGVADLSLGNLVGANILNLTLIVGTSATIRPLTIDRAVQLYNFPAMVAIFVLLVVLAHTDQRLTRREGLAFVGFYALYLVGLVALGH